MSMSHEEFRARSPEHFLGQLSQEQEALFQGHRQGCSVCAAWLEEELALWEMLSLGDPELSGAGPGVWSAVRRRTLGANAGGAWFFGQGRLSRTGLAGGALAAGLVFGWLLPAWTGPASTAVSSSGGESYEAQSSWLDDSSAYDLAGLWLEMGSEEESDGS